MMMLLENFVIYVLVIALVQPHHVNGAKLPKITKAKQLCVKNEQELRSTIKGLPSSTSQTVIGICSDTIRMTMQPTETVGLGIDLSYKSIRLQCQTKLKKCVLDGQSTTRFFHGNGTRLTVSNVEFKNGHINNSTLFNYTSYEQVKSLASYYTLTHYGGALLFDNASYIELNECSFTNNTAESSGAFHIINSTFIAKTDLGTRQIDGWRNSVIYKKNSATWGKGIGYFGYSNVSITGVSFFNNTAQFIAGFDVEGSTISMTNFRFQDNKALYYGGSLSLWESKAVLSVGVFRNNTASRGYGGGLVAIYSTVNMTNGKFLWNTAGNRGGSIYLGTTSATIQKYVFRGNTAGLAGGAIDVFNASSLILNTVDVIENYHSNSNITDGGTINVENLSNASLTSVRFRSNVGYPLTSKNASVELTKSKFVDNTQNGAETSIFIDGSESYVTCYQQNQFCSATKTLGIFDGNKNVVKTNCVRNGMKLLPYSRGCNVKKSTK